jgi:hypothetical protein
MTAKSDIPGYATLGPDPEPLGLRAELLLERIAKEIPCPR